MSGTKAVHVDLMVRCIVGVRVGRVRIRAAVAARAVVGVANVRVAALPRLAPEEMVPHRPCAQ